MSKEGNPFIELHHSKFLVRYSSLPSSFPIQRSMLDVRCSMFMCVHFERLWGQGHPEIGLTNSLTMHVLPDKFFVTFGNS